MKELPRQEPDADALAALAKAGLKRIGDSDAYQALRWTTNDLQRGILYASHKELRWAIYWRDKRLGFVFFWTLHLENALVLLSLL